MGQKASAFSSYSRHPSPTESWFRGLWFRVWGLWFRVGGLQVSFSYSFSLVIVLHTRTHLPRKRARAQPWDSAATMRRILCHMLRGHPVICIFFFTFIIYFLNLFLSLFLQHSADTIRHHDAWTSRSLYFFKKQNPPPASDFFLKNKSSSFRWCY